MPLRHYHPTVTVLRPWGCTLHYVGARPFGADEQRHVSLPPGAKFEKWPSTLTVVGPTGQDVALIREDGGTVLLLGSDFADLVGQGVLFDQQPCDPQEHDTEAEYRACPDCFPPFPS
jgi:hypothetical protein